MDYGRNVGPDKVKMYELWRKSEMDYGRNVGYIRAREARRKALV